MPKNVLLALFVLLLVTPPAFSQGSEAPPESGFAPVNGLELYYEVHGQGKPLVVLHGAYMTIDSMDAFISELAKTRQVIAVEAQGHGHTVDIDRPITYANMVDDVAALLEYLDLEKVDIFGYSMGAGTALQLALQNPERIDKLILASVGYASAGLYPEVRSSSAQATPEMFAGTPFEAAAARPEDFPDLVRKLNALNSAPLNLSEEAISNLALPALVIVGDADIFRPEHSVKLFRLLGGGVPGDLTGLPKARLAILPGTTHITVMERTAWLVPMIDEFLETARAE